MDLRNELLKAEIEGFGVATHLAEIRRVREQTALLRQQKLLVYRWGLGCPTPVPAFPVWRQGTPGPVPSGDRPPEYPERQNNHRCSMFWVLFGFRFLVLHKFGTLRTWR